MNSILIAVNFGRRIIRDYRTMLFMLVFPILIGVLAVNIAAYYGVERVGLSRQLAPNHPLVQILNKTGKFKVEYYSQADLESKIKNRELKIGVIIPEDFEEKLMGKTKPAVKVISLNQTSNVIQVRLIFEEYIMSSVSGTSLPHLKNAKNNIAAQRASLGFFLVFILLFSGTCAGLLVEDKKSKTFLRYFLAPVKEYELYMGSFITCLALGAVQILAFLGLTKYIFRFDWKISGAYVFLLCFTFLIASIGISIGMIAMIKDNRMYSLANTGVSFFTCFIGGAFFPSSLMGKDLDKISNLFPQKWVMHAFECLVDGQTLADIQTNLIILLLFGAIFFVIGVKALHPTESDV